jgi:nucleoside-diphosphate-sugar epimerase
MNILITGGLGILGNDLVKSLSKNHTLYLLDRFSHRNRKKINLFNLSNKKFNLINGSFNSFKCIYDILKKKKLM